LDQEDDGVKEKKDAMIKIDVDPNAK